jgi:peptidoglycan hydrolase-like protein with peptidoglycan-binding domain
VRLRVLKILALGAVAIAALLSAATAGSTATATGRRHVAAYFVQGEQLSPVKRRGRNAHDAVRQLIAGPTRAERRHGFRTYVPRDTQVRRVAVRHGLATVDLSADFANGRTAGSMLARLAELVRTLTGVERTKRVQLLIDGKATAGMFPGISTSGPITLRLLRTPNVPVPHPPPTRLPAPDPAVKATQRRLIMLGYMVRGGDDGRLRPATANAILTFQKLEGLNRTGLLDTTTKKRLASAVRPTPRTHGSAGKRAEVLLDHQVTLLIRNNRVVRAIAVSSGKPSTPTPAGSYRVYAKIRKWWSVPFREWLPYALPFVGGIAFHEFPVVPAYPASHGCVRQSPTVASWTYRFAYVGMPVKVIAGS